MQPYITVLPWDSGFFGVRIGQSDIQTQAMLEDILSEASSKKLDLVYLFSDIKLDGVSFPAEIRAYYEAPVLDLPKPKPPNDIWYRYRRLRYSDVPALYGISAGFITFSRFRSFSQDKLIQFYRLCVDRDIDRGRIYVIEYHGLVAGFVSLREGRISLIGVHDSLQGQGIGKHLLDIAMHDANVNSIETLKVNTNKDNLPARNLYEKCGFKMVKQEYIYHVWI